jgi:hypothetical protein
VFTVKCIMSDFKHASVIVGTSWRDSETCGTM